MSHPLPLPALSLPEPPQFCTLHPLFLMPVHSGPPAAQLPNLCFFGGCGKPQLHLLVKALSGTWWSCHGDRVATISDMDVC